MTWNSRSAFHGLAESLGRHENDVARVFDEVEAQRRLDERAIDLGGPVPVEVRHGLEALESAAFEATVETATAAILLLEGEDVLEQLDGLQPFLVAIATMSSRLAAVAARPSAVSRAELSRSLMMKPPASLRHRRDRRSGLAGEE